VRVALAQADRKVVAVDCVRCQVGDGKTVLQAEPRKRRGRVSIKPLARAPHYIWRRRHRLETTGISAFAFHPFGVNGDMPHFAGTSGSSDPKLAVNYDCSADSVADADVKKIARAPS